MGRLGKLGLATTSWMSESWRSGRAFGKVVGISMISALSLFSQGLLNLKDKGVCSSSSSLHR